MIRYVLEYAGADYELQPIANDVNDEILTWHGKMKTQLQMKNPLINLPFIITDEGEYITETVAIMMYLGDKFGFNGKTPMEKVRISEMMMKLYDFRNAFKDNVMMTPKGEKKEAFATRGVHTFLECFEKSLKIYAHEYICSSGISIADFCLFQVLDKVVRWCPSVLEKHSL